MNLKSNRCETFKKKNQVDFNINCMSLPCEIARMHCCEDVKMSKTLQKQILETLQKF